MVGKAGASPRPPSCGTGTAPQRAGALPVLAGGSDVLRTGVDRQVLGGDEPGLVRGEERDRVGDLLRLHPSLRQEGGAHRGERRVARVGVTVAVGCCAHARGGSHTSATLWDVGGGPRRTVVLIGS